MRAVGRHHDGGHQALRAARHDIQVESNEFLAGFDARARFDARVESAAAQLHRVDADVNQHIDAMRAANGYRVAAVRQGHDLPVARRELRCRSSDRSRDHRRACGRQTQRSGTSSSGAHQPSNGAMIFSSGHYVPDLDPVERPHGIEARTGKPQANIVAARRAAAVVAPAAR